MRVYRIIAARHSEQLLDGTCAARTGGRWNQRGSPAVYTSFSISLAILEAMHQEAGGDLVGQHCVGIIDVPLLHIRHLDREALPLRWRDLPYQTQAIGSHWLLHGTLALVVPSVIHDHEDNLLLNPQHPDFPQVTVESCAPLRLWERICAGRDSVKTGSDQ